MFLRRAELCAFELFACLHKILNPTSIIGAIIPITLNRKLEVQDVCVCGLFWNDSCERVLQHFITSKKLFLT